MLAYVNTKIISDYCNDIKSEGSTPSVLFKDTPAAVGVPYYYHYCTDVDATFHNISMLLYDSLLCVHRVAIGCSGLESGILIPRRTNLSILILVVNCP